MTVKSYRDLIAWQNAMDLVEAVYHVSKCFPREELYGLTVQLRKAAVLMPSNIAEGQGRQTTSDFLHFLAISKGSLNEAETQVLLAGRLGYIGEAEITDVRARSAEVGRLVNGQMRSLTTDH